MKNILISFFLLAIVSELFSQKTSEIYLPIQNEQTPNWFKIFYQKNYNETMNVFVLDEKVRLYKNFVENKNQSEVASEILTGEEAEDLYLLFYNRWRKEIDEFIQPDGKILQPFSIEEITTSNRSNSSHSPTSIWSFLGPKETFYTSNSSAAQPAVSWQVNIYASAVAPSDNNILFVGAETGGIYKTIDKGLNWISCTDNINSSNFYSIAIHPTNPDIVYAGKSGQIFKTIDGGVNWTVSTLASGDINTLIINSTNPNIVFAGSNNGLFSTIDAGLTWVLVSGMNSTIYDLAFQPNNDSAVFSLKKVGTFIEFWKSMDGGNTFTASVTGWAGNGIANASGARMTTTIADSNRVYAVLLGSSPSPTKPFIFRSNDGGNTWDTTRTGISTGLTGTTALPLGMSNGQGYYDLGIKANPNNADEVIVGTTSAYKSIDGGNIFNALGGYVGPIPIHPDIQSMLATPTDTWITTDGGMNYSTDFFSSDSNYTARNNGIYGSDFWGFAQGWNEDLVAGGRYHNGNTALYENYLQGNGLRLGGGEAGTGYYLMGKNRNVVFSDLAPGVVVPFNFNDNTTNFSFNKLPNEDAYGWDASDVEFFPSCYGYIYTGSGNELWKSQDEGVSWVSIHNFSQRVKKFEVCRSNPNVIYLATANSFYKSIDAGLTWSIVALPSGASVYEMQISVDYTDENVLWISSTSNSSGNRIFKSIDGGLSWINLTTTLINGQSYKCSVHQAGTNGGIYIIANGGKVFYRNNTMSDWADFSSALPKGFYPLEILPFYRDSKLRASGNRGIWQVDLYEEGVPIAQPTVDKLTSTCVRDTFYFDDFSVLNHAGATWNWNITPSPAFINSNTIRNPKVLFSGIGNYSVSLTVTNSAGTSTKTINNMIQITGNDCAADTIPGNMLTLSTVGDFASQISPMNFRSNTMSLSVWVKPDTIQSAYAGIVFSGSGGACGLNFKNNNQIGYHWAGTPSSYNWSGGPTIPEHQWSHLCLVITPTSNTIYLNGVAYNHTNTHDSVTFDEVFQIGKDRGYTTRNYRGALDEVCIYNRALTQNEVRELMNLTRNNANIGSMPNNDTSLIAYYQFNEGNGIPAYDRVGVNHLQLAGGANKNIASSAPIGGGVFQRLDVSTGGLKSFAVPGVFMNFQPIGIFPNGDVVVTRINVHPDQLPATAIFPDNPLSYYVIRNYGTNTIFDSLSNILFTKIQGTNSSMVSNPAYLKLYQRGANEDSVTWNYPIDSADIVTNTSGTGTVNFTSGLNLTSCGQFSIGTTPLVSSHSIDSESPDVLVFPNPSQNGWISISISKLNKSNKATATITNELGQLIKSANWDKIKNSSVYHLNIPRKGIYFLTLNFDLGKSVTRKIIVE